MLAHCDYLPSSPLLNSLLKLGTLYHVAGDNQKAIESWQRLLAAAPVNYVDQSGDEAALRQHAQENIATVQGGQGRSPARPKKWIVALLLSIFFGLFGVDRFYLGYIGLGVVKLFTAGGFYVWWLIDIIRIATSSLRDANGMKLEK